MALVKDMTKGRETPLLIKFMLPMLLGNVFQQFYNIADSAIVGQHEGATALGSIGCTGSLNFLFFSLCNGLSVGAGIIVAQHFGAGNDRRVKNTVANSLYIVTLFGILISVLGVLIARPVLTLLDTPKAQIDGAVDYMKIICGGNIAVALYNYSAQVMRALGDSKSPLIFLIVASFINVGLDVLFVIYLGYGIKGAAWATVIAQAVSAVASLIYGFIRNPYFRLTKENLKIDKVIVTQCLKIGMPLAAQGMLIAISCVILQRVVNSFDEVAVSAYTVTNRIEQLVQQPYSSLGAAVSTFTGQNMGAGKQDRVRTALKKSIMIVAAFSIIMLAVCFIFGRPIMRLFVKESNVIDIGAKGIRITSLMYFFLGTIYVTRGLLNGAGDAVYAMINGCVEVTGRICFPLLLIHLLNIGLWAIWLTTGLTWFITAMAGVIRYRQNKWCDLTVAVKEKNTEQISSDSE